MAQELILLSPEKTVLTYRIAGLGSRISAHILDLFIILALIMGTNIVLGLTLAFSSPELATSILLFVAILGPFAYFIFFEGLWNGQTLGKKAMGIRVRMADGTPVRFGAALTRNLLRPGDFLPSLYFAGLLAMFTNIRSQRLGDMVAGTVVISERKAAPLFAPSPHRVNVHPLEQHVGELRRMTSEEYLALRRLCDRFPELPPAIAERMMREIWEPFSVKHGIASVPGVHPLYLAEAVVMRYGREHGLL